MNAYLTLKDDVHMVCCFVFAHHYLPVRGPSFTTVGGQPIEFLVAKPLQSFDISQRCHYSRDGRCLLRRSCPYLGIRVHNGAGLPLRLAIQITVHRFLLFPGAVHHPLRWTLPILTPRLKFSIPYLEPNSSPTKWGATAAHPGVRRLLYQEKLRERRRPRRACSGLR